MIKHHPSHAVLTRFSQGDLEPSISLIVASHIEVCEHCKNNLAVLTEQAAEQVFEQGSINNLQQFEEIKSLEFDAELSNSMLDEIMSLSDDDTEEDTKTSAMTPETKVIQHKNGQLPLPRALNTLNLTSWQGVGKISRARFQFNDEGRRLSLLKIDKGGHIPQHTHTGIEITLLLEGCFEDTMGTYGPGDFIWLDKEDSHSPITQEGCICLTLVSDALHFTQGFSKLLNPLGKLIY